MFYFQRERLFITVHNTFAYCNIFSTAGVNVVRKEFNKTFKALKYFPRSVSEQIELIIIKKKKLLRPFISITF